jgi:hypothetical protein
MDGQSGGDIEAGIEGFREGRYMFYLEVVTMVTRKGNQYQSPSFNMS